jgi:glycosyltransferase involved in cell wall biosynthesis
MPSLGGSVFVHNALEFDYCIRESIASLCAVCDEVVALDASSTDGTLEAIQELKSLHPNLRIVHGANWECAPNYSRLAMLADLAKSNLKTDWHFMLQADEVIHEVSFPHIREAVNNGHCTSYMCRRLNLFGDLDHCLDINLPQEHKPCSDAVLRLATIDATAHGDAESLQADPAFCNCEKVNDIVIFHYGLARRDKNHLNKIISMQSWFFGEGGQPDHRVVEMKKKGDDYFDWRTMKTRDMLVPLPLKHPKFSKQWAAERQSEKLPID